MFLRLFSLGTPDRGVIQCGRSLTKGSVFVRSSAFSFVRLLLFPTTDSKKHAAATLATLPLGPLSVKAWDESDRRR